ncbi:InlB B-repeat-containing protein [Alkalibacter rhizosphaerae]|uniref:InlB B-repeat-containing protein n=1 Tax=Alkalibacter rhizosphaerae TaxID=2815577 RepID=A0A974XG60_9FIRM|nr:InlB B-repeat-containing protein [Alkalibacter rhizosphaerae]QSX09257.1 InlB B-repeat-containing protein [Alkalibacter rhizosphaerae]
MKSKLIVLFLSLLLVFGTIPAQAIEGDQPLLGPQYEDKAEEDFVEDPAKLKETETLNLMEPETPPQAYLDFTLAAEDEGYPGTSGEGWTWDPTGEVLTLNGITLNDALLVSLNAYYEFAILVPDGTEIVVNGTNMVNSPNGNGIVCDGDLTISGSGSLTIQADYHAIRATGNLDITGLSMLSGYSDGDSGIRVGPGGESVNQDGGHLTITDVGDVILDSYDSAMRVLGDITIDGFDSMDLTSSDYSGIRGGPDYDVEHYTDSAGNVSIMNGTSLSIDSYEAGIRLMGGNVTIDGVTTVDIYSDDNSAIHAKPYDVDYFDGLGILENGDVTIKNCTTVDLSGYDNGIRNSGNVILDNIQDLTIFAEDYNGIRSGPDSDGDQDTGVDGDVSITNCGDVSITAEDNGIRAMGNLVIDQVEIMFVVTEDENGFRVGPGADTDSGSNGNASITNVGTLDITADHTGMRVIGDLLVQNVDELEIVTQYHTGIRVGLGPDSDVEGNGDAQFLDCGTITIRSSHNGMRITGNLTVDGLDELNIDSEWTGLRVGSSYRYEDYAYGEWSQSESPGNVVLKNIAVVDISGLAKGINSTGSTWIENCPDATVVATALEPSYQSNKGYGIMAGTEITVKLSHLVVYGHQFGLVTGWTYNEVTEVTGGDITIDQSYVDASCASDLQPVSLDALSGNAAIFAGDDKTLEETGHAQIILSNAVFKEPADAYIADVVIGEFNCQSVTNLEELEMGVISYWGQALNAVIVEPLYLVTYDGNGGTGTVTDTEGPYLTDATVTVKDNAFTLLGYTFNSFNTKADGTGETYAPGATFGILGNVTLYAQWDKIPPVVKYVETDPETGLVTEGMKTNVILPELEDPDTKEVEVYVHVVAGSLDDAIRSKVMADLKDKGYELLDILDINLMKKVTEFDGTVTTSTIDNADITGPITVRVLLTGDDVDKDDLAIAYIDDAGNVTVITGTKVTVGDKVYVQFVTDHFSNYALIQALGDQETNPDTGVEETTQSGMTGVLPVAGFGILLAGYVVLKRKRTV